jgi:glutamate synthase (NADPH/NADH) small chain
MADVRAFITLRRATPSRQTPAERLRHWNEFYHPMGDAAVDAQASRCMDCGVPFCQSDTGCPVRNIIPEWNELVRSGRWREASNLLHSTNNFPELTGRLCPAPCESACVLSLIDQPVAIRTIEQAIADRAFAEGWVVPQPPRRETGRRVAIVGSGPAGLAAAQQLRRVGHAVTVFERAARAGGLLRYGIPDFKLEKTTLDRRLAQLSAEGVVFRTGFDVGTDVPVADLRREFDAVCVATGASVARDIAVPGRGLGGIHAAMQFLAQQNTRIAGEAIPPAAEISARGKHVVIIGGGDTGSDCAGTALRQGAVSVTQFELMPRPPEARSPSTPWPLWPMQLRTSHSHEEGGERDWSTATTGFSGERGAVRWLHGSRVVADVASDGSLRVTPVPRSEFRVRADLVLLAMGFSGCEDAPWLRALGVTRRGQSIATNGEYETVAPGVFAAGDARRGASLIVWAIREGRDAAAAIARYLAVDA